LRAFSRVVRFLVGAAIASTAAAAAGTEVAVPPGDGIEGRSQVEHFSFVTA
jgi:hypothetical protein